MQRTISAGYRDVTQFTSATSDFDTETITLGINYDWPITEYQYLGVGLSGQRAELVTSEGGSATQATDWVRSRAIHALEACSSWWTATATTVSNTTCTAASSEAPELNLGWRYDSRNRAIFADRGARHRFNIGYTVPGSDVEFWTASYDYLQFVPVWRSLDAHVQRRAGLWRGPRRHHGAAAVSPVFLTAARIRCVAFAKAAWVPRTTSARPYGGNIKTIAQTELLLPMPEKVQYSARFSLFYDIGNVFSNQNIQFFGPQIGTQAPQLVDYGFSYDELRQSAGVAVQWLAPLGVFRFSYAVPLKKVSGDTLDGLRR